MLFERIFSPNWKHGTNVLIASILINTSLIVFYHLNKELVISQDFKDYSRSVDNLINLNFNFYKYYINSENNYSLTFFYSLTVFSYSKFHLSINYDSFTKKPLFMFS